MTLRLSDSTEIKPLTKRVRETGELYRRRPDADLQIEKVLLLEKPQILAMLENKRRDEAGYLLDETIVYLLRAARAAGDDEMIETLYLELNARVWKLLGKFRRDFINQADFDDFGQKIGLSVMEKIFDLQANSGDYAQVNFGDFVVKEATVSWRRQLAKDRQHKEMFVTDREDDDAGDPLDNVPAISELAVDSRLIIREGFEKLSRKQQMVAAMMIDGFQIDSKDKNELTISKYLNVSERTIRNWRDEIRAALSDYRGEAKR